jgi:hypothetical protein
VTVEIPLRDSSKPLSHKIHPCCEIRQAEFRVCNGKNCAILRSVKVQDSAVRFVDLVQCLLCREIIVHMGICEAITAQTYSGVLQNAQILSEYITCASVSVHCCKVYLKLYMNQV